MEAVQRSGKTLVFSMIPIFVQKIHMPHDKSLFNFSFQKHDLFLSDKPIAGYLGSSSSSVAGYLTQGSMAKSSSIPNSPPPLIE